MRDFKTKLEDYIRSGHATIVCETHEIERALAEIHTVSKASKRHLFVWSISSGWVNERGERCFEGVPDADKAIEEIHKLRVDGAVEPSIFVLKFFNPYLHHTTYGKFDVVLSLLQEVKEHLYDHKSSIVFLGPEFDTPIQLRHDVTSIEFELPDEQAIKEAIKITVSGVIDGKTGKPVEVGHENLQEIVRACKGMARQQIMDRVALALRVHKKLDHSAAKLILNEKANVVSRSGVLKYYEPPEGGMKDVGGLENLKHHIALDKPCFTDQAREYGIEFPKGILLVGVPGGGKTLASITIASEFGYPLIAMDVGNLMSSLLGESEANLREAIRIVESIAPCVLQLDEIEKGFATGDLDGGASRRMFGAFIKWLNDRTSPVYLVATANTMRLPPEFARKGRFDEIFFVDLPNEAERAEIARIHLAKRKRDPGQFDIDTVVQSTSEFTGADIEQCVKLGLKMAFSQNTEVETDHLIQAAKSIVPLARTEPHRISEIREWGKLHAKPANQVASTQSKSPRSRRIEVRG